MKLLLLFCVLVLYIDVAKAGNIKAVSLGGWLVTEGWIKPSLFDGIPNKDLLDGTNLQLRSVTVGKYLCAENGGGSIIVANRTSASGWETFTLWRINATTFNFRVFNKQFVGFERRGNSNVVVANGVNSLGFAAEPFEIHRDPRNSSRVRIKASNGFYFQVKSEELVSADYEGEGEWGDDNPSVFVLTISNQFQGEYQITNGYGPLRAPRVMKEHWNTYIVEEDFNFIKSNGLDAVRIPVGWWIAQDPSPPKPFVGGSLAALDNAFKWADKYGINVIIDLHAAPGSQNGWEHSGTRDGSIEWGQSDDNIRQTVHVIEFLTARYAKRPSLYAVELMNEPLAPGVSLTNLTNFYKAGYNAVRKHSRTAYVIMCNRLGVNEPRELFSVARRMNRSVIDVHFYNIWGNFSQFTVEQNIEYIYKNRTAELKQLRTSNGPLIFVGEWVAEWAVKNASESEIRRYGEAQLQVYGNETTFGWAYWTLKNVNKHWSLEWMINNGYIKL
ncbi:Unknown protein [Striga hermonthica]|uniref:Mannan endo-1,4-beta-mannosidase n=1 Tax=Striga hermonthica TaxID=68872 RepID=A0A9N7RRA6_STRHE|nr:Unknown protein [Striga hermonthica]